MTKTYTIAGLDKCSQEPPLSGTRVYLEPAVTGHGTVYVANKAYAGPSQSFGWIPKSANGPTSRCMGTYRFEPATGKHIVVVGEEEDFIAAPKSKPTAPFQTLQEATKAQPQQEPTMSQLITKTVTANKNAATSAAFMEAGRVANNQVAKALAKKAPVLVRGYVEHPIGKLVIANVAVLAAQQFRPNDKHVGTLAQAMAVQAYQELIQEMNIEEFIDELLATKDIKRALSKLPAGEGTDAATA